MSQTIETCHYRFGAWEWPSPPGESPGRHRLRPGLSQEERGLLMQGMTGKYRNIEMAMDQYLLIPFLVGWTSVYQLFWWSPGVQGFDTLPNEYWLYNMVIYLTTRIVEWNIVYIYMVTTFEHTDFQIYEQVFETTSGKVFLGTPGHLNLRNPIHLNIR